MSNNQRVKAIVAGLFLVSAVVLASCGVEPMAMEVTLATINAWVGGPPDGAEIPLGENPVLCHFFADEGVASGELWVNGSFANGAANPDPGNEYFTAELSFQAPAPGTYVLECVTTDQADNQAWSEPATVFVSRGPVPPPPPPEVPAATPTETEVPREVPTATPTSRAVPTNTPTSTTRPTNTPTSTPTSTPTTQPRVVITMFEVSKTQTTSGECVRFTWRVEAPTEIYFDGEGVTNYPAFEDRCPTSTRAFELRAEGYGGPVTASITVVVIQPSPPPSDTEGPSIWDEEGPEGMVAPMGGDCLETYQFQAYVSDPSGVRWVKLICSINQRDQQACGSLELHPRIPNLYRIAYALPELKGSPGSMYWYIRACDLVDPMNCSNSPGHTTPIGVCVI